MNGLLQVQKGSITVGHKQGQSELGGEGKDRGRENVKEAVRAGVTHTYCGNNMLIMRV